MNSDSIETAKECARDAGAIVPCPICGNYDVAAHDEEADKRAYAYATEAWKDQDRGFRSASREEVMELMKAILDGGSDKCPSCC